MKKNTQCFKMDFQKNIHKKMLSIATIVLKK